MLIMRAGRILALRFNSSTDDSIKHQVNFAGTSGPYLAGTCACDAGYGGMDCSMTTPGADASSESGSSLILLNIHHTAAVSWEASKRGGTEGSDKSAGVEEKAAGDVEESEAGSGNESENSRERGSGSGRTGARRFLSQSARPSRASSSSSGPSLKPLFYVVHLPARYTTHHVFYSRLRWDQDMERPDGWIFLERCLRSQRRTFDPEEADFFVMPIFGGTQVRRDVAFDAATMIDGVVGMGIFYELPSSSPAPAPPLFNSLYRPVFFFPSFSLLTFFRSITVGLS